MHRATKFVASLFLTAALAAPVVTLAGPATQDQDNHDRDRVYDREHKDYHQWDDHEKDAWGRFLAEKHRKRSTSLTRLAGKSRMRHIGTGGTVIRN